MNDPLESDVCGECGAKVKKHKITLNKSLAMTLVKLRRLALELGRAEIWLGHDDEHSPHKLSFTERSNMSRLRFLGLARYTETHSGHWFVTKRGNDFLDGAAVPAYTWTFRNKVIGPNERIPRVTIDDIFGSEGRPYYDRLTDQARPTAAERAAAVPGVRTYRGHCTRPGCTNTFETEAGWGVKPRSFCSLECKNLVMKKRR